MCGFKDLVPATSQIFTMIQTPKTRDAWTDHKSVDIYYETFCGSDDCFFSYRVKVFLAYYLFTRQNILVLNLFVFFSFPLSESPCFQSRLALQFSCPCFSLAPLYSPIIPCPCLLLAQANSSAPRHAGHAHPPGRPLSCGKSSHFFHILLYRVFAFLNIFHQGSNTALHFSTLYF